MGNDYVFDAEQALTAAVHSYDLAAARLDATPSDTLKAKARAMSIRSAITRLGSSNKDEFAPTDDIYELAREILSDAIEIRRKAAEAVAELSLVRSRLETKIAWLEVAIADLQPSGPQAPQPPPASANRSARTTPARSRSPGRSTVSINIPSRSSESVVVPKSEPLISANPRKGAHVSGTHDHSSKGKERAITPSEDSSAPASTRITIPPVAGTSASESLAAKRIRREPREAPFDLSNVRSTSPRTEPPADFRLITASSARTRRTSGRLAGVPLSKGSPMTLELESSDNDEDDDEDESEDKDEVQGQLTANAATVDQVAVFRWLRWTSGPKLRPPVEVSLTIPCTVTSSLDISAFNLPPPIAIERYDKPVRFHRTWHSFVRGRDKIEGRGLCGAFAIGNCKTFDLVSVDHSRELHYSRPCVPLPLGDFDVGSWTACLDRGHQPDLPTRPGEHGIILSNYPETMVDSEEKARKFEVFIKVVKKGGWVYYGTYVTRGLQTKLFPPSYLANIHPSILKTRSEGSIRAFCVMECVGFNRALYDALVSFVEGKNRYELES